MARCKGCIHDKVCNRDVGHGYSICPHYTNTADVSPKSEVDRLIVELESMRTAANSYKMHYENLAREIFEEIEKAHDECIHIDPSTNIGYLLQTKFEHKLAELKKKYTGEQT